MEIRVTALGLLLCYSMFTAAIFSFNRDIEVADEASDGDNKGNATVDENSTWYCPDKWIPYSSDSEVSCLSLDRTPRSFPAAGAYCQSLGVGLVTFPTSDKETFVKSIARRGEGGEHWVGLYKDKGYDAVFQWQTPDGRIAANPDSLPQQMKDYISYKEQCAYISTFNEEMEMDDCESEYFAICEKEISCRPGTFGDKCERECHCVGEPCNPKSPLGPEGVTCKWGCQRNWMGIACDTEKQDPEVKYFCINSAEDNGKYVYIRIYTKGLQYRAIYGLTANNIRGDWCSSTTTDTLGYPYDLTSLTIPVNKVSIDQMSTGKCVGQQLDENTFTWAIVIKENDEILLEHDRLINVTCNFRLADSLVRSDQYSIDGEPRHVHHETIIPESIQDDVILQVVNAYSGEPVNEASIGSTVVLQMKYGLQKGSLLRGVFPYKCVASYADGSFVKQLLDENGCQVPNSPLQPFALAGHNKIETPWFNLFAFDNEQTVTFHCSFELCFTSKCHVGCWEPSRQKRDTPDGKDEVQHVSTTRTIRVLPSISAQKPAGDSHTSVYQPGPPPAPAGYDIGPFVYLNPVTCTLFLLILLIFLCMYIAFLRTLRKSVYDIRKEIEVKRSRDKFLHCGCVQQKDRDFIVA